MKTHKDLLVLLMLLIISCNKDDHSELLDDQKIVEKIEVQNGILSFSSKDFLSKTVENLKEIKDNEKEIQLNQMGYVIVTRDFVL